MLTATQAHFENSSAQSIRLNGSSDAVPQKLIDKLNLGGVASDGNFRRASGPSAKPNIALWVTKDHQIYQEEIPYPVCGPADCIVHVRATGICGSEIHFWKSGRIGDCMVDHDLILGHESSGEILEVGLNVKNFKKGDRVSIEPGVTCWGCKHCISGRYNLCPSVKFSGTPPSHGTMARYIAHPARFLHKIPDSMSFAQGALVEPFSVAVGAVSRAQLKLGQPVLICGAGPIGLAAALCARASGAHPICITDLEESRLEQARHLGFNLALKIDLTWDRFETSKKIRETLGPECTPEIAFECTGAQSSIVAAIYAIVDGGTLLQVGCGKPDVELPLMAMGFREVNIVTSFRYKQTWPTVIRLLNDGVLGEADKLITHTFPVEQIVDAFETCIHRETGSIKVQIVDG
ncbi:sorbitol dehydrogenase [Moniliophthora roreri MCA 2997]|uniref:L-arabinitol 4-dehydrogenase n=1 Tax=Moniliophthora roreri (strain MCA 2997) TaxID=1381753 RepID=V2WEP6_MONRO|nr:sorbitol dehydrogenase [Moniliophthora roreri MCA 2997]